MASLEQLVREHTALDDADLAWLQLLVADWQIVADLSFADLVLWLPDADGEGYHAGAQMRPTTGPTAYVDDVVGTPLARGRRRLVDTALDLGRISREGDPEWRDEVPVRVEAIPVRHRDRVIAVVARNTNLHGVRTPSRLELSYLQAAGELTRMIAGGHFPTPGPRSDHADTPRVGDGFIRLDPSGQVAYASPNALSVFRKLGLAGDLTGRALADVTRELVPARQRSDEETLSAVLGARLPRETELGNGSATVVLRAIPLRPDGQRTGGLVLLRDVTDLRRRDRELVTKDATIREIHHRVKNNLQTVAALLRMQSRRMRVPEAREGLDEAVRRVGSIAVVHELLSQSPEERVDFDQIADRLLTMVCEVGAGRGQVVTRREGSLGLVPSDTATPLAMVLTELLQNAVEHGFGLDAAGSIVLVAGRDEDGLLLRVEDDGRGVADGVDPESSPSLGLSIVRTLLEDLGGRLSLRPGESGGTVAEVRLRTGGPPGSA